MFLHMYALDMDLGVQFTEIAHLAVNSDGAGGLRWRLKKRLMCSTVSATVPSERC